MNVLVAITLLLAMLACVALIPLGLPGLWLIVAITGVLVFTGTLALPLALGIGGVALVAEVVELFILRRFGRAYGGSRRAFWGAVIGGMAGLFVGLPVPVVGSVVTAFLGTFAGAGIVTWMETRSVRHSARVGWGVLLARTFAVGLKVAVAVSVIGVVAVALIL